MLNKLTFSSIPPGRAKTPCFLCVILGSSQSAAYPSGKRLPGNSRLVGENRYASGFLSPVASRNDSFEHPKRFSYDRLLPS
jgi:hypothetical protein